jgi:hypothetical protein
VTGPPGPGHVTTGIGGLGMAKRTRDLAKWGTGGVTGGNGQVTRLAGLVVPRAPAVWLTGLCRRTSRAPHNDHADVAVRGHTGRCQEGTAMPSYQERRVLCPTRL